jgi:hopanoid biosynthesis associated protein HpnK
VSRRVIITADDFGLAKPVNEAIERAYRDGVLTTTSLLIGSAFAGDAILRAHRNPGLRVGLHVALCEGKPLLTAREIPDLVNSRGELHGPIRAWISFFLLPRQKPQIERELRAQLTAFLASGLVIDHVNGHNNMQMHPVVLPILLRVAREFGVRALRISCEPLLASARAAGTRGFLPAAAVRRPRAAIWLRFLQWCALRPWAAYVKWRCRRAGFLVNDYLFGIYDCGGMDLDMLVGVIRNLPEGVSEIHCHPASERSAELTSVMPDYEQQNELSALISPELRQVLSASGVQSLRGFTELSSEP